VRLSASCGAGAQSAVGWLRQALRYGPRYARRDANPAGAPPRTDEVVCLPCVARIAQASGRIGGRRQIVIVRLIAGMGPMLAAGLTAMGGPVAMAQDGDFADGLAGGPDFWAVTGVPDGDTLDVRSGPATKFEVRGELANGDVVRNLGCRMEAGRRWCRIGTMITAGFVCTKEHLHRAEAAIAAYRKR
jgi:hypothetical protein